MLLIQSRPTLCDQAPLSMRFSRQEYWGGFLCCPPGDLPDLGIKPTSLATPELAGGVFTTNTTWSLNGSFRSGQLLSVSWTFSCVFIWSSLLLFHILCFSFVSYWSGFRFHSLILWFFLIPLPLFHSTFVLCCFLGDLFHYILLLPCWTFWFCDYIFYFQDFFYVPFYSQLLLLHGCNNFLTFKAIIHHLLDVSYVHHTLYVSIKFLSVLRSAFGFWLSTSNDPLVFTHIWVKFLQSWESLVSGEEEAGSFWAPVQTVQAGIKQFLRGTPKSLLNCRSFLLGDRFSQRLPDSSFLPGVNRSASHWWVQAGV